MDYIYSQRDPKWADLTLGTTKLKMRDFGCVVTDCAMILSYYYDRQVLPSEFLRWLNEHNGFTYDGLLYWNKLNEFTGGRLRYTLIVNPGEGEVAYGIRQVYFGRYNHWVIDHPKVPNKVIDPFYARVNDYNEWRYTNLNRYFIGKPIQTQRYPVDDRYGQPRTWTSYLLEQKFMFHWIPGTPAAYIYQRLGRSPSERELKGLVYGHWDFEAIFLGANGNDWLYEIK